MGEQLHPTDKGGSPPPTLLGALEKHNPPPERRKLTSVISEEIYKVIMQNKLRKGQTREYLPLAEKGMTSLIYGDNLMEKWQGVERFVSWGVKTPWGVKEAESS